MQIACVRLNKLRCEDVLHYREVFEHVCVRLDEVPSMLDVCEGLRDAAIGKLTLSVFRFSVSSSDPI
jgi:hypothetical protein